jgi:hypothetical protein
MGVKTKALVVAAAALDLLEARGIDQALGGTPKLANLLAAFP